MSINSYFCVKKETENEMIIERSRFISYVKPCRTEEEARAFIEEKRKAHPFATHNCYAYIVERGSVARFSTHFRSNKKQEIVRYGGCCHEILRRN